MDPLPLVIVLLAVVLVGLAAWAWRQRTGRWPWRALIGVALGLGAGVLALFAGRRSSGKFAKPETLPDRALVDRIVGEVAEQREEAHEAREDLDAHPEQPRAGRLGAALRRRR